MSNTPGSGGQKNPAELSSAAATMLDRLSMMRACYGGTQTMRAASDDFLPQYDKESNDRYQVRVASTFALNKLREAVDAASAKPFRTIVQVKNTDPDFEAMVRDIDLQGNHLHIFAHQFFNNAMLDSMCHILVDHPDTTVFANLAQQKAANIRPFWKLIKAQDLVAAYDEYVGGDIQTTHVRFKSTRIERGLDFKEKIWNQIYIIEKEPSTEQGVVQLWEQAAGTGGGEWALIGENPVPLTEVPFVTLYAGDKESDYVANPVFKDLAYKQIEHFQSSSDQRSILTAGRFPMLAASGVQLDEDDENEFAIGPYKVLVSPEANGRWYYVEPKGSAIESGQKDLEMLEMQMDMMALNPVTGTHRQYVPQNERNIQETRVHSVVHDITIACQDAIEKAIRFTGQWTGRDYALAEVLLNKDFASAVDKMAEVAHLIKVWEKRGMTRATLLSELKQRDLLSEGFDIAEEVRILEAIEMAGTTEGVPTDATANAGTSKEPAGGAAVVPGQVENWPAGQNRPTPQT